MKNNKKMKKKLNIYFTAGIPKLNDTTEILKLIQHSGADYIEIGMPYSDPVADGPVIQKAHEIALKNGMTIAELLGQLRSVKSEMDIPIILMGYINPVFSFGFEDFCKECKESGVSGLIIPDLPPVEFEKNYRSILEKHNLNFIFLVTPETSDERIKYLDSLSSGFLRTVSTIRRARILPANILSSFSVQASLFETPSVTETPRSETRLDIRRSDNPWRTSPAIVPFR